MADERQEAGLLLLVIQVQQFMAEAVIIQVIFRRRRRRTPRRRWIWVRTWLDEAKRSQHKHYNKLMLELLYEDPASYFNYLKVPPELFDELLDRLRPALTYEDTHYRKALEPGLKLAMTMRNLASGDRCASMKFKNLSAS